MHEGEKGEKFYIIIKGTVAFYKNNAEKTQALKDDIKHE